MPRIQAVLCTCGLKAAAREFLFSSFRAVCCRLVNFLTSQQKMGEIRVNKTQGKVWGRRETVEIENSYIFW